MTPSALRTPRLLLRPIAAADTAALTELFADPELSRFHAHDLTRPDEVGAMVERRLSYRGPGGDWVIELDGHLTGAGHLRTSTELPGSVLECGWYLARRHWGIGLGAEAAAAIVAHGHHALAASAVFALVHEDNVRARTFTERLGFVDLGAGAHYGATHRVLAAMPARSTGVHHVELWVADLAGAEASFGWLFTQLGWHEYQRWDRGVSWRFGSSYVVVEDSPARGGDRHERTAPGLNHLALHAGSRADVDRITAAAAEHGWQLMFADRHPHAGGPDHYAAYLENADGFEIELVAT